jgi:hypothetical protein
VVTDPNKFKRATRETLAKRSGQICSNPYCKAPTSGPHSEEDKTIDVGEAAHIRGALPGAKRYDPGMTPTERRNITNGIWLCRRCAKLIDSDANKYTVELLYKWKRTHEAEIERRISSSGWQRLIHEQSVKAFEQEGGAALQIALDCPDYWEYLLAAELLRYKLSDVKRNFDELKRGLIFRPTRTLLEKEQLNVWIQNKLDDLVALIKLLSTATTEELQAACGEVGQSGNAFEILRATNKITEGCNWLLDWEIDLHFTRFPTNCNSLKQVMEGWTEDFRAEMDRIPDEITKIFNEDSDPEGIYIIDLDFKSPQNFNELLSMFQELWHELD